MSFLVIVFCKTKSQLTNVRSGHEKIRQKHSFRCDAREGAILLLPLGSMREDLHNLELFRDYAIQNAESWYRHLNGPHGRNANNGSICLVTGYNKAQCWLVSSFSRSQNSSLPFDETFEALVGNHVTTPYPSLSWENYGYSEKNSGPETIQNCNQCIFLRGFTVTLDDSWWARVMGTTVALHE